jgi:hypothetical protein
MSPVLFEISEDGRLTISPNAHMIEETKDIIDKYDLDAEAPLAYCHLMSSLDSPLRNLPYEEKKETAIIEVNTNIGSFDEDDPLLDRCIKKLTSLYSTPIYRLYEMGEEEIHNMIYYLKTTPMSSEDLSQRKSILQDLGKLSSSLASAKRTANEEMNQNTRGDQETGQIY